MKRGIIIFILLFLWGTAFPSDYGNRYIHLRDYYKWMNPKLYLHIVKNSVKYNVSEELISAVIKHESNGKNIRHKKNRDGTYDYGVAGINEVNLRDGIYKGKGHKILLTYKYNIEICAYKLNKALKKARYVKISKKDKVKEYQGIIKEACRMYNQGLNGRRYRYNNWKYTERIYADYKTLRRSR
jgi:hypothetical protein